MRDDDALEGAGALWAWRHPKPAQVSGLCIGQTDVKVSNRRAKRLARRIQKASRRHGLARVVYTSPLQRCALVGRHLRRWGWTHVTDPALLELHFGTWDGQAWSTIPQADVDRWCEAFANHAPGGGECLQSLLDRAGAWAPRHPQAVVLVAHAGWMLSRRWVHEHPMPPLKASEWPASPAYGALWHLA
ncbi:histidine phosphatase family protein [Aquabacterium sp.]|uniref:histidine phosphatase family protein n=1 Tax=Aquabacterium sp. TaxID=1872578 RepID=UPI003D6CCBFA